MFDHHRKSPWFAEKYDPAPEYVNLRTRVRKVGWKGRVDAFLMDLEAGNFDPDLNEPVLEAASVVKENTTNGESATNGVPADVSMSAVVPEESKPVANTGDDEMQFNVEPEEEQGDNDTSRIDANGKFSNDPKRPNRGEEMSIPPEGNQVMIRTIPPDIGRVKLEEVCSLLLLRLHKCSSCDFEGLC